jgi:hypothetical protein
LASRQWLSWCLYGIHW